MDVVKGRFQKRAVEPVQLLPEVTELVGEWLQSLDCEESTKAGYGVKLLPFIKWFQAEELRPSDLKIFIEWMETNGHSQSNRHEVCRRLRQFFRWLYENDMTPDHNLARWVPKVTVERAVRLPAPIEALSKLMRAASLSAYPERNTAMIAIMLGTGMRRTECANLRIEDITIDADGSGIAIVRKAKRVRGRSVHQRVATFDAATGAYVRSWLDVLNESSGALWPSYSFMSAEDDSLTAQGIYKVVASCIDSAGLIGVIKGCHDLRRLFITYFRRNRRGAGYDKLLGLQVGHKSSSMTDVYDLSTIEDVREAVVSPLSMLVKL